MLLTGQVALHARIIVVYKKTQRVPLSRVRGVWVNASPAHVTLRSFFSCFFGAVVVLQLVVESVLVLCSTPHTLSQPAYSLALLMASTASMVPPIPLNSLEPDCSSLTPLGDVDLINYFLTEDPLTDAFAPADTGSPHSYDSQLDSPQLSPGSSEFQYVPDVTDCALIRAGTTKTTSSPIILRWMYPQLSKSPAWIRPFPPQLPLRSNPYRLRRQ